MCQLPHSVAFDNSLNNVLKFFIEMSVNVYRERLLEKVNLSILSVDFNFTTMQGLYVLVSRLSRYQMHQHLYDFNLCNIVSIISGYSNIIDMNNDCCDNITSALEKHSLI